MDENQQDQNAIIRVVKDRRYFVASNEPFNDKRIKWETRGLLAYLLSKPDTWELRIMDLVNMGTAGEYKIRAMLDDARKFGYVVRVRITESAGVFTWKTFVYESPSVNPFGVRKDIVKITRADFEAISQNKPVSSFPQLDSPTCGKPPSILNTNKSSTDDKDSAGDPKTYQQDLQIRYQKLYDFYVDNISPKVAPLMKSILRNTAIDHENLAVYDPAFESYVKNGATSFDYLVAILDSYKNGKQDNGKKPQPKQATPAPSTADDAQEARARIAEARAKKSQESI